MHLLFTGAASGHFNELSGGLAMSLSTAEKFWFVKVIAYI
jgi:hypothetical protein